MTGEKRYTVQVDRVGDAWMIQSHRWTGTDLASGEPIYRATIGEALEKANELVTHRLAAGRSCVLVLSDEAQAASN